MRVLAATISAVFLYPALLFAQGSLPKYDAAITVGSFSGRPHTAIEPYGTDWWQDVEWRASAGRMWTPHLKTELELGTTGEGSRYVMRLVSPNQPYSAEEFYRQNLATARVTYQFLENAWVHPYVSAGVALEAERLRVHVQDFYRVPAHDPPAAMSYRGAVVVGTGAKFYMSPRAFFKAGAQGTYSPKASSISFLCGIGVDF